MNWFDTSGLTNLAKTALKEAQKTIDKALDITEDESGDEAEGEAAAAPSKPPATSAGESTDFFASWGLTVSAESAQDEGKNEVVTESPSKGAAQSVWGSFTESLFDNRKADSGAITAPPKAKSMNVISDGSYGSQDDLFSKSQLVMSDGADALDKKDKFSKFDESVPKVDERRSSSRSAGLSLISSRNSSDSVEVLSHSLKTTPDSEAASVHSISHSSSVSGQKHNSESVEILPDSLVSPSSIECLGFDSYASEKSSSSNLTPDDGSDKKSTPIGERTEKGGETADSVSLVADDDEDTISYNSISECTAPTVLDNDDKSISPFPRTLRPEFQKKYDKELIHLDQPLPHRMQMSENSSNDGSWSDRTLNADNDSINNLDPNIEEPKKEVVDSEENLLEKLSDSSSFYNVNVSAEMLKSESSAFVNVESQQCQLPETTDSPIKDISSKERTSPISSDSTKSDLVKIGSDRTSGHTSGDEVETATSSDIEIIPSPNGDNHSFCRSSPAKYAFKQSKLDGSTSPNLVDLVLGKSLASKIRGHNRELSQASIQSNTSDDSGSENDKLMRRLCEMAEILEARETRLMEVSRSNAELAESNADLKTQMESLLAKHEVGDINVITEDYTQRLSALEKKFQQAIREKDQYRKQLDTMKSETASRKNFLELENTLKEKDEMISQLQEEGEKLSRQQLQHSNIIKKLRQKEKDNEQVIKSLRDKIAEQSNELERVKRAMAAKEELEVTQIEAVYRLTTANKKLETELNETKSTLDDTTQRLETSKTSLEATRKELSDLQRSYSELQRRRDALGSAERDRDRFQAENEVLKAQLQQLRSEMVQEDKRWQARTEALRSELSAARAAPPAPAGEGGAGGALLAQLAHLQRASLERERAVVRGRERAAELEMSLAKTIERERLTKEENQALQDQLATSQGLLEDVQNRLQELTKHCQEYVDKLQAVEEQLNAKSVELESVRSSLTTQVTQLTQRATQTQAQLETERAAWDTERKRHAILQEQLSARGDVSPPHSVMSDTLSNSLWGTDEGCEPSLPLSGSSMVSGTEELMALLQRREGELRAASAQISRLQRERRAVGDHLAQLQGRFDEFQSLQEQYDALLQMYGEKEEQLTETRLDLQDVTQLYKQQLQLLGPPPPTS
ncbi:TATA element modulatory factor [Plutella xylostella]|uniref:TATA element modulatory factor n=1 Tax=Plutella xylostella TaxID=51655 RepID=UPI00203299D7|nr:TATA element modulatory factor [Plutella xylostella]